MRTAFALARVVVGIAMIAAVFGQLQVSYAYWVDTGITDFALSFANYFSYFTIESNLVAAVTLLIGAVFAFTRAGDDPRWFTALRGTLVAYLVVTGIVYNALLRGVDLGGVTLGWSNEVLHVVAPLWMVVDWLFAPGRRPLAWRTIWVIVAFPVVWAVYTLGRGPFTLNEETGEAFWYPYPFLDPNVPDTGYLSVAGYIVMLAAVIGAVGAAVVWISRAPRHRATVVMSAHDPATLD